MANRRFIDFPIASSVGENDIILIWQSGANKQTTKGTLLSGIATELENLTDVQITSLANGQILEYDSVIGKWKNVAKSDTDLADLGDVSIISPVTGQVLVYNATTGNWENSSAGLVPYVGAVSTVNLGNQQLIAGKTTITSNGGDDTLIVNHTSGSGIALDIAKKGSGEGLRVVKTSGSGNAVTITGGNLEAPTIVKTGGTSSEFLKADGSVDSTAYGTGSVTSVSALTLGTSGTDLSSTVANSTTTPVITLNVPTASATNRGALSSVDWATFNGKQNALTNPVTGTGTSGTIPIFTGSTTLGDSIIQANATQVNIVGNGSSLLFDSLGSTKDGGIQYTNSFELLVFNSRGTGSSINLGNSNINLITNSTTRLRITNDGNVLVGTTTDNGARLRVSGGLLSAEAATLTGALNGTSASFTGAVNLSTSTGNVGIGTSTPTDFGSTYKVVSIDGAGGGGVLDLMNTGVRALTIAVDGGTPTIATRISGQPLIFSTNNAGTIAPRLTLASTGAATFSSSVTALNGLFVGGSGGTTGFARFTDNVTASMFIGINSGNPFIHSNNNILSFGANGSNNFAPTMTLSNGNVGIGTTSPGARLTVEGPNEISPFFSARNNGASGVDFNRVGNNQPFNIFTFFNGDIRVSNMNKIAIPGSGVTNINIDSSGDFTTSTSDKRKKTHISNFSNGLDIVNQITPVKYYWKDDTNQNPVLGFYAQDVYSILPELVFKNPKTTLNIETQQIVEVLDENGHPDYSWGMNQDGLIAVMWSAIQEQQSQIEILKNQIT